MPRRALEPLPIDRVLPQAVASLRARPSLVLVADTGAGKTTRVPPALLEAGVDGRIVMLEPRRIAARAAARRIADEHGWTLGAEVGYQVRFDRRAGPSTRILVLTEGILVRVLQDDPLLEGTAAVIFDELHERSLDTDLSLAMARRVQREVRPDLMLVAMSATLEAGPVARFLGDCPVLECPGRRHPVELVYLESGAAGATAPLAQRVAGGVRRALEASRRDVLAFLPGVGEIRRAADALAPLAAARDLELCPLYGDLPAERQDRALRPGARRRVVLATNVAESSITVDGVDAVVDSGLARTLRYDPATGLDRLVLGPISRASADQRSGRAGRQGPGWCLRLWTAHDERGRPEHELPEIRRVDLAGPTLQLLAWGERDPARFDWLDAPGDAALEAAMTLLRELGALGPQGVTPLGQRMARLPLHPRLALLVAAGHRAGVTVRAARVAALLGERDVVHRPHHRDGPLEAAYATDSDVLDRLRALERGGFGDTALGPLVPGRARTVLRVGDQVARLARRALGTPGDGDTKNDELLLRALLAAYPDRVAARRAPGQPRAVMVGGRGVRLAPMSTVREAACFVCVELDAGGREAAVRIASAIEEEWLDTEEVDAVVFDQARERVIGLRRTVYRDLVLRQIEVPASADVATEALVAAARERLPRALALDDPEVASFLVRLRCLASWLPEHDLPTFDDEALASLLPALAAGKRSFADLRKAPLRATLEGTLDFAQRQLLAREAPERLRVPSGSRVALRYAEGEPPVLAVRIQELFGWRETPRIAAGRVPVLLHLLAPNRRPQQVTRDLASFWANTYPEVRKELAGRYPKHPWPEDPLTAQPTARAKRRR